MSSTASAPKAQRHQHSDGTPHILNDTGYAAPKAARRRLDDDDPHNNNSNKSQQQQIVLNGRPIALLRQPTKYPHGLGISIQTVETNSNNNHNNNNNNNKTTHHNTNDVSNNYTRSSTLPSNWDDGSLTTMKAKGSMPPEKEAGNAAELHERHLKFPQTHTNMYTIDHHTQTPTQPQRQMKAPTAVASSTPAAPTAIKTPLVFFEKYAKRFGRWKYLRWPLIFVASALLLIGLISYCIWLHDASVARAKYLSRVNNQTEEPDLTTIADELEELYESRAESNEATIATTSRVVTTPRMTLPPDDPHESTILKAIGAMLPSSKQPKEQKLTTLEYERPSKAKGATLAWEKKSYGKSSDTTAATTTESMVSLTAAEAALVPKSTYRFTSGHQNSFGVPIEEDERVLRLINGLYPIREPQTSTPRWTKVSPTIPPVTRLEPTKPSSKTSPLPHPENGCFSPSLPMCQGVLDYDLTYNATISLDFSQTEAYESLIHSNCSARAVEFICATLEPECRPSHIGVLPPCRRICKAILEACSVMIANSDPLSSMFDCSLYPDSNDPDKCEDPTRRRDYCNDNEFQCDDRSCIPYQWQCDNIKDCDDGEDEADCLVCDQPDEFRCRSNEKCVADSMRCDSKYDCFDGSDEEDCDDYGYGSGDSEGFGGAFDDALNSFPRIFSYASFLSPNQTGDKLYSYVTATADDDDGSGTKFQVHEITNRTSGISNEEVTNSVPGEGGPKGFVNFRDSKEIMMTSDTENNFKYSSATRSAAKAADQRNSSLGNAKYLATTTPLQPEASYRVAVTTELPAARANTSKEKQPATTLKPSANCAAHQLRCVSGKCITVAQLCDKVMDCPDGADERMCVYKERLGPAKPVRTSTLPTSTTTTTSPRTTTTTTQKATTTARFTLRSSVATTSRSEKQRTVRTTTIRRKVKN